MQKYTEFGFDVQVELLKQGLTVPKLAKKLGISSQYLLDILKGNRPGNKQRPLIANELGIKENEDDRKCHKK